MSLEVQTPPRITFPHGKTGVLQALDTSFLGRAEARQQEVQYLTKEKAPELMTYLNRAWESVSKMVLGLQEHLRLANKELGIRRAIVMLDILPGIVVEKKIRSVNEEVRNAVLAQDEPYQALVDRVAGIEVVIELLKIKAKGLYQSWSATKAVYNDHTLLKGVGDTSMRPGLMRPDDHLPLEAFPMTGEQCPVCEQPQYMTPGGTSCSNGHGGA